MKNTLRHKPICFVDLTPLDTDEDISEKKHKLIGYQLSTKRLSLLLKELLKASKKQD